jgi:hypothetical protein
MPMPEISSLKSRRRFARMLVTTFGRKPSFLPAIAQTIPNFSSPGESDSYKLYVHNALSYFSW